MYIFCKILVYYFISLFLFKTCSIVLVNDTAFYINPEAVRNLRLFPDYVSFTCSIDGKSEYIKILTKDIENVFIGG